MRAILAFATETRLANRHFREGVADFLLAAPWREGLCPNDAGNYETGRLFAAHCKLKLLGRAVPALPKRGRRKVDFGSAIVLLMHAVRSGSIISSATKLTTLSAVRMPARSAEKTSREVGLIRRFEVERRKLRADAAERESKLKDQYIEEMRNMKRAVQLLLARTGEGGRRADSARRKSSPVP